MLVELVEIGKSLVGVSGISFNSVSGFSVFLGKISER